MLKTTIIGASGYTGAELALMVHKHPQLTLSGLYVSANSVDAGKSLAQLHGRVAGLIDMPVQALTDVDTVAAECDVVFLATAHEVSHDLAPQFLAQGCQVFDLSGAFRVQSEAFIQPFMALRISILNGWKKRCMAWLSGMRKQSKPAL